MDLDWYFNQTILPSYEFDFDKANANGENRIIRFSPSQSDRLETLLIDPLKDGWLESLKYSSAIPYLYKTKGLVDGGVTAPVPVSEAHALGANKIVTIRTSTSREIVPTQNIKKLRLNRH